MGCGASKLDELPAVSLCRDRRAFSDEAVRHRFALAQSHASYLHSLTAVGLSLDRFFNLKTHHHIRSPSDASGSDSFVKKQVKEESTPVSPETAQKSYDDFESLGGSKAPPRSSAWDFLNPFETFDSNTISNVDNYNGAYSIMREEEGIPDLEDEDDDEEKEARDDDADQKHVLLFKNEAEIKARGVFRDDSEVVKEIRVQFQRASDSGADLAEFLEVGKLQYKWKRSIQHHHVSWMGKRFGNGGDPQVLSDVELRSKKLSSTLHKLYLWETKLHEQVKVEEKMRVLHDHKLRKLKHMDEKGSDTQKVEAARTFIRSLSTNINIAIQVVDNISVKINKLRDEELLQQLHELIQGLARMWKSMLECHRNQCRAIREAEHLEAMNISSDNAHLDATSQLGQDLLHWSLRFSQWVKAQKCFVRALNNWLTKCLLYVPEETPDGIAPFSPGRMGAPRVFVVCHRWAQLVDGVSEKEVVDSMRDFASNMLQLWDRDKADKKQERKMKSVEGEHTVDKKIGLISAVYPSETTNGSRGVQASLKHALEAMSSFTANSLKVYEELLQGIET